MGSLSSPVLELARPFLRGELEKINPKLPSLIAVLKSVGAGECWHKHGSFLHHLVDVYKILKLWKAPEPVCLCGLFHSAYSNSYVNLAIFDPSTGRDVVRGHVGEVCRVADPSLLRYTETNSDPRRPSLQVLRPRTHRAS